VCDVLVQQRGTSHVVLHQLRHLKRQQGRVCRENVVCCTGQTAGMGCI
jgi:hypothetical protein